MTDHSLLNKLFDRSYPKAPEASMCGPLILANLKVCKNEGQVVLENKQKIKYNNLKIFLFIPDFSAFGRILSSNHKSSFSFESSQWKELLQVTCVVILS